MVSASANLKIPASVRLPVFFLLLVFFAYLLQANARQLLAELYAIEPRHLLTLHDDSQWRDRDAVYADALATTDSLLAIQVNNPEYQEMRGRLLINRCQHWNMVEQWDVWLQCQRDAQAALRVVVQENPRWPYGWANLLLTKFNLRQFDEEFYQVFQHSRELGASEMAVNRIVTYVGLHEWVRWRSEMRPEIRQAFLALYAVAPYEAAQIAHESGQDFLFCLWTNSAGKDSSCSSKLPKKNP